MDLDKIINFEGKRNCSLTLFIPRNCLKKTIVQVEKKIFTIKHENKKFQLVSILNEIKKEAKKIPEKHDNFIICIGLSNNNQIEFFKLNPEKQILNIEYFYDYKFHINKIYEFLYSNVKIINDLNQQNEWVKILSNNDLIIYENEINKFIELNLISDLLYFSNDILDISYVKKSQEFKFNISIFPFIEDSIRKQFGNIIGILYFKISDSNIYE